MKTFPRARYARLAAVALTVFAGGCAGFGPPFANQAAGTAPLVQNCAVLNTGTPSRFACNGKVYTSFQLAKLREDEAKRYASGK